MVDGLVGDMVDALKEAKALDQTVIILSADNGGKAKGHGGLTADHLYIPWIAAGPGINAGELMDSVNTFDTAATIAALFELQQPQCWIGRSVLTN